MRKHEEAQLLFCVENGKNAPLILRATVYKLNHMLSTCLVPREDGETSKNCPGMRPTNCKVYNMRVKV